GIGTISNRVKVNATTLNLTATDGSSGSVFLQNGTATFNVGTANIGNTLDVQCSGSINLSDIDEVTVPTYTLRTQSGGNISVNANFTGSNILNLLADGSVTRSGSFTVTAPALGLVATTGNIGSQFTPLFVGGGNSG